MRPRAADAPDTTDQATISYRENPALWLRYRWPTALVLSGFCAMTLVSIIALAVESGFALLLLAPWWFLVGRSMWGFVRFLCGADVQVILFLPGETDWHKCVGVSTDGGQWVTPVDSPLLRDVGRAIVLDGGHRKVVIPADQLSATDRSLLERRVGSKP